MGEGEDVMVAHEGEAVVLGGNENLTCGCLLTAHSSMVLQFSYDS
jgi:hypothetical protein